MAKITKVEAPPVEAPPATYHLELTKEEFDVVREACYHLHWSVAVASSDAYHPSNSTGLTDDRADEVALDLYSSFCDFN